MTSADIKRLLRKYMKAASEKDHAKLSASGSERWLGCPASISLSEGRKKIAHESAAIGTNAHTLLQFILENLKHWQMILAHPASIEFRRHINYDSHQLLSVMVAVKFVRDEMKRIEKKTGHRPTLYVEKKVHLDGVGFGTSDIILHQPYGLLHVMDFKNGKSKVKAQENTQGLYYGVGAADEIGWDFNEVHISIIQPNAKGWAVNTWKTTPERLEKAKLMLQRGAAATRKPNPAVVPNYKYCYFCPARESVCPAHKKQRQEKIMTRFQR